MLLSRILSTADQFGLRYRVFIELLRITYITPKRWRLNLARLLGRLRSPYRGNPLFSVMSAALQLDEQHAKTEEAYWLANHGISISTLFHYPSLAPNGWLNQIICVENSDLLREICMGGGLVLTTHCHHQNLIAAYLGAESGAMYPLAASAESSGLYRWIGRYIKKLNRDSEAWFGEGHYLYTDNKKFSVRTMLDVFARKKLILALCDVPSKTISTQPANGRVFGRFFTPPTGSIKAAIKQGVPIYFAHMASEKKSLVLLLNRISTDETVEDVLHEYCGFLEKSLRRFPHSWQGWEWWSALPDHTIE